MLPESPTVGLQAVRRCTSWFAVRILLSIYGDPPPMLPFRLRGREKAPTQFPEQIPNAVILNALLLPAGRFPNDQLADLFNNVTIGKSEFVGFRVNNKEFMPNAVTASEMVVASCRSVSSSERTAP